MNSATHVDHNGTHVMQLYDDISVFGHGCIIGHEPSFENCSIVMVEEVLP